MGCMPNTIYYCSISAGAGILTAFSCGDPEADSWAVLCLENVPPFHARYFQTFRNRLFAFLMEDGHVFFVIADVSLGKAGLFDFLGRVKENFEAVIQNGATGSFGLTSFCLRDALHPVLLRLIQSLENVRRVDGGHKFQGSPNGVPNGPDGPIDVVIEPYPNGSLEKSLNTGARSQLLMRKTWWRHVWIALSVDLVLCLILFGVWLGVCNSFTCLSG